MKRRERLGKKKTTRKEEDGKINGRGKVLLAVR